jgi:hypothetical protein
MRQQQSIEGKSVSRLALNDGKLAVKERIERFVRRGFLLHRLQIGTLFYMSVVHPAPLL